MDYQVLLHNLQIEIQEHIATSKFTADFIINDLVPQVVDNIDAGEILYITASNPTLFDKINRKYKCLLYKHTASELVKCLTEDLHKYFNVNKKKAA